MKLLIKVAPILDKCVNYFCPWLKVSQPKKSVPFPWIAFVPSVEVTSTEFSVPWMEASLQ